MHRYKLCKISFSSQLIQYQFSLKLIAHHTDYYQLKISMSYESESIAVISFHYSRYDWQCQRLNEFNY